MKNQRLSLLFFPIIFVAIHAPQWALAQTPTAAEWSSRIWAAASDGNWAMVDSLLNQVPAGNEESLVTFRNQLDSYRSHKDTQSQEVITARDEALVEMKTFMEDGKTLQAMQKAVEAQTLSRTLDEVMLNEDVQAIVLQTQKEIDSLTKNGNILTAQMLIFRLRTFYEGTSRIDKYEHWDKKYADVNLKVALLRQYAPEHMHSLFVERAELLGDDPPPPYNEQASNNWIERVDGIEQSIVIRSLDIATSEHMSNVSWEALIVGGLNSVLKLGVNPIIAETFPKAADKKKQEFWLKSVHEELQSCSEY